MRSRAPFGAAAPVQRSLTRLASTLARRIGVPAAGFKRSGPRYCGFVTSRNDILCSLKCTPQPVVRHVTERETVAFPKRAVMGVRWCWSGLVDPSEGKAFVA